MICQPKSLKFQPRDAHNQFSSFVPESHKSAVIAVRRQPYGWILTQTFGEVFTAKIGVIRERRFPRKLKRTAGHDYWSTIYFSHENILLGHSSL